jgi:energy-coupling factor transport system permease protein
VSALGALSGPSADVDPTAVLARANPVAKLVAASVMAIALLATVDPVTASAMLLMELAAVPWTGVALSGVLRRGWIVLLAAALTGSATLVFGVDSGSVLLGAGPLSVTTGSLASGLAVTVRILALGLPGVLLLATTDPTDLADALAQVLRLPHRFVLSALAAMRLAGVLSEQWQELGLARRARGLGDDGLRGRITTTAGQIFALLVVAIRAATVMATAMEARGFGVQRRRTWARPSRFGRPDAGVVLGGIVVAALATTLGVVTGSWQLVLS